MQDVANAVSVFIFVVWNKTKKSVISSLAKEVS
jgi:hypothetical protein